MKVAAVSEAYWPDVRHLLLPAIERAGEYDEAEVLRQIEAAEAQLWLVTEGVKIHAAVVTSIAVHSSGRVCLIWLIGGNDAAAWIDGIETIERAAADAGCVAMEISGRPGWQKMLPEYRRTAIVLRKAL
jgi:phage tail sheath gpL-like